MKQRKSKAFTLIELIAVLVIMAIIALIATPLVMNIIRKARISADRRSVDAYGRSIELAIAGYLLDNGKFPTEVSQLTIEYSGNQVVCETTQLNSDSSVYLAGCTVNGRGVEGYTYGKEETIVYDTYEVGDEVSYNNVNYYVIKDSGVSEANVTLLKAEPLSVQEMNTYGGVGTENNHVNMYVTNDTSASYYQTAYDKNGYGGMSYYSSVTCGYNGSEWVETGCTNAYEQSEVKYVVDAWKAAKASAATEARLITFEDLTGDLGFELQQVSPSSQGYKYTDNTPSWVYNSNYLYWTMSQYNDSPSGVYVVGNDGELTKVTAYSYNNVFNNNVVVRPVIVLPKSAL